jgi:hypothetical protein
MGGESNGRWVQVGQWSGYFEDEDEDEDEDDYEHSVTGLFH